MTEWAEIFGIVVRKALQAWSRPEVWGSLALLLGLVALTPRLKGAGSLAEAVKARGFRTDALYVAFYMGGFYSFLISPARGNSLPRPRGTGSGADRGSWRAAAGRRASRSCPRPLP